MIKQLNIAVCLACIAAIGAKSVSLKVKDGETADHQLDKRQATTGALHLMVNGTTSGNSSNPMKFHVKENAGSIVICVMLVGEFPPNKTNLTDNYFTTDNTAMDGIDYEGVSGSNNYTDDNRRFYIEIIIKDNSVHDGNKRFHVHFRNPSGCIPDEWIEICIWDDEWELNGGLHLVINGSASGNVSDPVKLHVKENDGSITICVMLVGEFPSNKTSLTDMFSTSEDTAGELVDTNTFMLQMYGITHFTVSSTEGLQQHVLKP